MIKESWFDCIITEYISMLSFNAQIQIIGINPYVLLPDKVLVALFAQANKKKGAIPVKGKINGQDFIQTLVKYSGKWRLYLNTPMRRSTNTEVGDKVSIEIEFDPVERLVPINLKLKKALDKDRKAKKVF
jgi:hypothetical protein